MRLLLPLILLTLALPAQAEVTHTVEGRFGVAYRNDGTGAGQSGALYEGRYTASFAHRMDNGVRFRFDIGVVVTNFEGPAPLAGPAPRGFVPFAVPPS
jgi:hypothetical protein